MKVRLTDGTSTTVTLAGRHGSASGERTALEAAATKRHPCIELTNEYEALAGGHGIVGIDLTAWDALLEDPKDYGFHFQLAGQGGKK